jgi:hypothetical protein
MERFEDIEVSGEERWLGELAERLKEKDHLQEAVKRISSYTTSGSPCKLPVLQKMEVRWAGRWRN